MAEIIISTLLLLQGDQHLPGLASSTLPVSRSWKKCRKSAKFLDTWQSREETGGFSAADHNLLPLLPPNIQLCSFFFSLSLSVRTSNMNRLK